jgi:hypothetical protein
MVKLALHATDVSLSDDQLLAVLLSAHTRWLWFWIPIVVDFVLIVGRVFLLLTGSV